ncbi:MAG: alkaline phosphatase family protein [Candidatus Omnitrophica bacterium]|nr:alkaline phosphatase family protein [Candidatus Omnitrophota bacterium]
MDKVLPFITLGYIDPGTGFTIFSLGGWMLALLVGILGFFSIFFKKIFNFFKKHFMLLVIILCVLVAIAFIVKGVFMKTSAFDKRIIILGFDAMSPEIIEPMMKEGRLPNFARLKEAGSYSRISTSNPPQSPVAWSAISTGKNPGKNGIFDFIVRDPKTYRMDLSLAKVEGGKAVKTQKARSLWQYLSDKDVESVVLACPVTFPPDKIRGRMLSGMGVPDILGTEGTFTFYTSENISDDKDIGGKVFHLRKSDVMVANLIGPKVAGLGAKPDNVKVPFKVTLTAADGAIIEFQKQKTVLRTGEWSPWQEVSFDIGFLKKARGIFKFYLVSVKPEFRLYISPINFDPREPLFPISYPKSYSKELAEKIGLYHTQGMPMDTWAVNELRLAEGPFLEQADEILRERKAMLDLELSRLEKGVLFCYFETPDIIQHMFWRYRDEGHPLHAADLPPEYKETIERYYIKMDRILGEVMETAGKQDTIIALSDHGFATFRRAVHVNSWLKANGYLVLKNPYAESGAELLADVDWSKTKAYAIGFGAVYVNQKGRERDGIVSAGDETERLKNEIVQRLAGWIDKKYNQPVVSRVYKREEIFWGDNAAATPDLYIGFNNGYRASWQTAMGGSPEGLIEDNLKKWSGDHLIDPALVPGVIFSNKKITKKAVSLYDVAPTVLKVSGYSDKELKGLGLDGSPIL